MRASIQFLLLGHLLVGNDISRQMFGLQYLKNTFNWCSYLCVVFS